MKILRAVVLSAIIGAVGIPAPASAEPEQGKVLYVTSGSSACQNSVTGLLKEEITALKRGEVITIVVDKADESLVSFPLKAEEFPVSYERLPDKENIRFVIRRQ